MPTQVDREAVRRLQQEGALLVDVLPEHEYEMEHIAGAINVPLESLTPDAVEAIPRDRPLVVYCNDFL